MAGPSHGPASFWTQANALLRKNLTFQKRNMRTNILLVCYPALLCILIVVFQHVYDNVIKHAKKCDPTTNPNCPTPEIPITPPLLQVPRSPYRAVRTDFYPFNDLPDESCRRNGSCPATILLTGNNHSLGEILAGTMITSSLNTSQIMTSYNDLASVAANVLGSSSMPPQDLIPLKFLDEIIYLVQRQCTNNFLTNVVDLEMAYDFLNSNKNNFNMSIWYNSTYGQTGDNVLLRIPRSVNLASNAYLHFLQGPGTQILFEFVKDMQQRTVFPNLDIASLVGPLFFTWVVLQLFPVALKSLVYEKQQKLRIMMKMHGLGDGPYWMISYLYFLFVSLIYMLVFVASGALLEMWVMVMELYPGFSLYRGLYEFAQYAQLDGGMRWEDLNDSENGMKEVLIIMFVDWLVVLFVAYGIDRVVSPGSGVRRRKSQNSQKKPLLSFWKPSLQSKDSTLNVQMDKADVNQEREKVDQLLHESSTSHAIVCDNLQKIYPESDGNPEKLAVQGLYLTVPRGECFGMLGPNGAGKTSFINMMIGLTKPTTGTAFVQGLDIRTHMNEIYTNMGVCPQHDLLWETLTGREHLLFYGRLKNLKGSALTQAVEESLKSLNLFHGGVANKQAGKYSGGMKRRLSVAISLIGDPRVVYMDEPSTGLDPASKNNLWNVVKNAKQDRAIILTTHSMEEAEFLCDRLGFFVDGSLQCIGNPKELKARYGGSYVFTITTSSDQEEEVENMVQHLAPSASKVYQLSGTQKFEIPKSEIRIADVFQVVETAKRKFTVFSWGLADTNMEDVFIKVSREARQSNALT
ncbi:hypothetical protein CMV_002347 [Castanea mollissima]|uniref:ABC transporter domain-containing protein n=1 Tax=Castanea mollissima TaxID=60419 RepID=A0A8J4RJ66_9ROSI|nr:hypothetical protein CMV_002347 [Castanea mollissima]